MQSKTRCINKTSFYCSHEIYNIQCTQFNLLNVYMYETYAVFALYIHTYQVYMYVWSIYVSSYHCEILKTDLDSYLFSIRMNLRSVPTVFMIAETEIQTQIHNMRLLSNVVRGQFLDTVECNNAITHIQVRCVVRR